MAAPDSPVPSSLPDLSGVPLDQVAAVPGLAATVARVLPGCATASATVVVLTPKFSSSI